MPLTPEVQVLLEQFEAQGVPPFDERSVPQARDAIGAFRDLQGEPEPVGEIRDILAGWSFPSRLTEDAGIPAGS